MKTLSCALLASSLLVMSFLFVGCGESPSSPPSEESKKKMETDMQNMSKMLPERISTEPNPAGGGGAADEKK